MSSLYFDNAATTIPSKKSIEAYNETLVNFPGNPSSSHALGQKARECLKIARERIANSLDIDAPSSIIFTSSATESNNIVMQSPIMGLKKGRIIISKSEHPSVAENKTILEHLGFEVVCLSSKYGLVDEEELKNKLTPDTILVAIIYVNNTNGAVNDIPSLANTVKEYNKEMHKNILFHTDAVQSVGKFHISARDLTKCGVTSFSLSSHKFNAPRGCGILYSTSETIRSLSKGGGQENTKRGGTENLASIVATGVALKDTEDNIESAVSHYTSLKETLIRELTKSIGSSFKVLSPQESTPGIVSLSLKGLIGEIIVRALSDKGIYIGTTSACSSNAKKSDKNALTNMGYSSMDAQGTIRVSFSYENTTDDVIMLTKVLSDVYQKYHT